MPIPLSDRFWDGVTIDFVTDLPESKLPGYPDTEGYTSILVIVDHHGVPSHIITGRGVQFTLRF
jgi:hypothetical protein